jgi:hypothetical protein
LGPSFTPSTFICSAPIQTAKSDNNAAADNNAIANSKAQWRFKTRQQTYRSIEATLKIRGVGGTSQQITHQILFDKNSEHMKVPVHHFAETFTIDSITMTLAGNFLLLRVLQQSLQQQEQEQQAM